MPPVCWGAPRSRGWSPPVTRSEAPRARPEKAEQLRAQGAEPVTVDLFDPGSVRAAVDGCQGVVHMATNIPPLTKAGGAAAWATNDRLRREGTQVIADACRDAGVEVLVKETVSFFYADGGDQWIDEDWPIERQPFSDASLDAEDITLAFTGDGRRGVVLRFGLFYSARRRAPSMSSSRWRSSASAR